jgi:hypothetical protein
MKFAWKIAAASAVAVLPAVAAIAQESPPPATRVETIPAHRVAVERDVVCRPAVLGERQVPVYETVKVPVVETRRVPVVTDVQEPVYATREVQAYESRQVPVTGPVEVPVYGSRSKPVSLEFTNPFTCCDVSWHLWDRCETVQVGTRTEQGVVGWRTEQVPVTRTETYVAETRTRQVQTGERLETVTVGERDEQRCTGWRAEPYEIRPAVTQRTREQVEVPAESVTVVAAASIDGVAALPGTTRVLTEQEFERAKSAASAATPAADAVPVPSEPPAAPGPPVAPVPAPAPAPAAPAAPLEPAPAPSADYVPPMPHPERK